MLLHPGRSPARSTQIKAGTTWMRRCCCTGTLHSRGTVSPTRPKAQGVDNNSITVFLNQSYHRVLRLIVLEFLGLLSVTQGLGEVRVALKKLFQFFWRVESY
jgi:hypothetical protein